MTAIPRYTEGQDLFDDQAFAHSILTAPLPTAEQVAAKEQVLTAITQAMVYMGVPEDDIGNIILCKFGIPLSSMGAEQLLDVQDWVERRLVASPTK